MIDNGKILLSMPTEPVDLCFNLKNYLGYEIKGVHINIDDEIFYLPKEDIKNLLKDFKKVKDETS